MAIALIPLLFSVSTNIPIWRHFRAMGNTFFADVLLMLELAWLILRERRGAPPVAADGIFRPHQEVFEPI
jgi:hypothetical protein